MDFFNNFPAPLFHLDKDALIIKANPLGVLLLELSGSSPSPPTNFPAFFPEDNRQKFREFLSQVNDCGQKNYRSPLLLPTSGRTEVSIKGSALGDSTYCILIDPIPESGSTSEITQTCKRIEAEEQQVFINGILEHIQDGIIACDNTGRVTILNQTSRELYKSTLPNGGNLPESALLDAVNAPDKPPSPLDAALAQTLSGAILENDEFVLESPDKSTRTLRVNGQAVHDRDGNKLGAVVTLHDITDLEKARSRLRFYAYHDTLTQLPNRRLFHDLLRQSIKQAKRNGSLVGILFVDLDNFKSVNDRFGHDTGDRLLTTIAEALRQNIRDSDLLCRWGGDEFIIALPDNTSRTGITGVAKKLCRRVETAITGSSPDFQVSISIGIALFPDHGTDPDVLIRNADMALYIAKRQGKNRFEVFLPETLTAPGLAGSFAKT